MAVNWRDLLPPGASIRILPDCSNVVLDAEGRIWRILAPDAHDPKTVEAVSKLLQEQWGLDDDE